MKTIIQRVAKATVEAYGTQKNASKALGIPQPWFSRAMRGLSNNVDADTRRKFVAKFGHDPFVEGASAIKFPACPQTDMLCEEIKDLPPAKLRAVYAIMQAFGSDIKMPEKLASQTLNKVRGGAR